MCKKSDLVLPYGTSLTVRSDFASVAEFEENAPIWLRCPDGQVAFVPGQTEERYDDKLRRKKVLKSCTILICSPGSRTTTTLRAAPAAPGTSPRLGRAAGRPSPATSRPTLPPAATGSVSPRATSTSTRRSSTSAPQGSSSRCRRGCRSRTTTRYFSALICPQNVFFVF